MGTSDKKSHVHFATCTLVHKAPASTTWELLATKYERGVLNRVVAEHSDYLTKSSQCHMSDITWHEDPAASSSSRWTRR